MGLGFDDVLHPALLIELKYDGVTEKVAGVAAIQDLNRLDALSVPNDLSDAGHLPDLDPGGGADRPGLLVKIPLSLLLRDHADDLLASGRQDLGDIGRHPASADHDDLVAYRLKTFRSIVPLSSAVAAVVGFLQQVRRVVNAPSHGPVRIIGICSSHSKKDGREPFASDLFQGIVLPDHVIVADLDPRLGQPVDLFVEPFLIQTEIGDPPAHGSAQPVPFLEDGGPVAGSSQLKGCHDPCRAASDDGDPVKGRLGKVISGRLCLTDHIPLQDPHVQRLSSDVAQFA